MTKYPLFVDPLRLGTWKDPSEIPLMPTLYTIEATAEQKKYFGYFLSQFYPPKGDGHYNLVFQKSATEAFCEMLRRTIVSCVLFDECGT